MLQAFLNIPIRPTAHITVTNGYIYHIFVIFMDCLALKVERVWKWRWVSVSIGWAGPVSNGVITIGVERKSRPLITPL